MTLDELKFLIAEYFPGSECKRTIERVTALEAQKQELREALKAICDEQDERQGHASIETYDAARNALENTHDSR